MQCIVASRLRVLSLELEASRLAVRVFNTMYDVCRQWNDELPLRKMRKSRLIFDVYVHAIKNTRRKMEDRHVVVPHFNPLMGLKVSKRAKLSSDYHVNCNWKRHLP